ncbi:hypothetical protein KUL49_17310 [Alteromonas sp. KUL49]|nr:hypothetical protein KUL49_17310 [Alteromonas sp. KUL49]
MPNSVQITKVSSFRYWYLWSEMTVIFCVLPLSVYMLIGEVASYLMVMLFSVGVICLCVLLVDKQFNRQRLVNWRFEKSQLISCLSWFIPLSVLMSISLYFIAPEEFMRWPMQETGLWLTTLIVYPIVSVIPQELIFRTFFFHRYKPLLPSKYTRWGVSTFLFGLAHVVYGNWIAVILSWCGGALFGYRYIKTRSTPAVVLEHTLWGSFLFTVGFGSYLVVATR